MIRTHGGGNNTFLELLDFNFKTFTLCMVVVAGVNKLNCDYSW